MKHQHKLEYRLIRGVYDVYKICQFIERVYIPCKHFISWLTIFTGPSENNISTYYLRNITNCVQEMKLYP